MKPVTCDTRWKFTTMKQTKLFFFIFLTNLASGETFFSSSVQNSQRDFVWDEALNVMSFHRNKMNEYLCKNYIASEIVESFNNRTRDRMKETGKLENQLRNSRLARESMLADPGSQKYKDWLSRSSTLEDIYHQFEHSENDHSFRQEAGGEHEGEVTGYALVDHKDIYSTPIKYGEEIHSHSVHEEKEEEKDEEHYEKGLKLKELFHFALTAIAFLAFACFMIEVIMCLIEVPQTTEPDYVLVPTTTGGTGHASKFEPETPGAHRQERILNLDPMSMEVLNTMSSKVLSSIEALTSLHEDDGQCLQRTLCENNKYAKTLSGTQKIWLPLWSFGMSWIGGRFSKKNSSKGLHSLDYLKAAVMGLGNGKCHVLYPKCHESKRRRKKKVSK